MNKLIHAIVLCAVLLVSATFVKATDGEIPIGGLANPQTVQVEATAKTTTVWDIISSFFSFKT